MGIIEILNWSPCAYNTLSGVCCSIIGISAFVCYLYEIHKHYGWLPSISKTFYKVREIFQMFMYLSSFCILFIGQNVCYGIVALCFTIMAMFPSVLYRHFIIPHCIFATLAIAIGLVGLPVCFDFWTGVSICFTAVLGIVLLCVEAFVKKNKFIEETLTYWIEIDTLSCMIFGLLLGRFF